MHSQRYGCVDNDYPWVAQPVVTVLPADLRDASIAGRTPPPWAPSRMHTCVLSRFSSGQLVREGAAASGCASAAGASATALTTRVCRRAWPPQASLWAGASHRRCCCGRAPAVDSWSLPDASLWAFLREKAADGIVHPAEGCRKISSPIPSKRHQLDNVFVPGVMYTAQPSCEGTVHIECPG